MPIPVQQSDCNLKNEPDESFMTAHYDIIYIGELLEFLKGCLIKQQEKVRNKTNEVEIWKARYEEMRKERNLLKFQLHGTKERDNGNTK